MVQVVSVLRNENKNRFEYRLINWRIENSTTHFGINESSSHVDHFVYGEREDECFEK
jgi:hypothetical protein